jgi:hypothetical protein
MRILNWLFGNKEKAVAAAIEERGPTAADNEKLTEADDPRERSASRPSAEEVEAENLRRWRESGQTWAWVQAREGRWDHDAWLGLLEELKRSSFWPMCPDAVGQALEKTKREWLSRN